MNSLGFLDDSKNQILIHGRTEKVNDETAILDTDHLIFIFNSMCSRQENQPQRFHSVHQK